MFYQRMAPFHYSKIKFTFIFLKKDVLGRHGSTSFE